MANLSRAHWLLIAGLLPLSIPTLLFFALFAAMAESGGKEPNLPLAFLGLAASIGLLISSWISIKKAGITSAASQFGYLSMFLLTSLVLTPVILRVLL